jgi:hypothetical protein
MGGHGSGRVFWSNRKTLVEHCLSISASKFAARKDDCHTGTITWSESITWGNLPSVSYSYLPESDMQPLLILSYGVGGYRVTEPVSFQKTSPHFGGTRGWFTCPMCSRRVGNLYLPGRAYYFACRQCHKLTYKSSRHGRIHKILRNLHN